jgi:long-subunit fatty acid transport protein
VAIGSGFATGTGLSIPSFHWLSWARCAPAAVALLLAGSARASAPDLYGYGARSSALAGAGAADASGYDAAWANPAGLAYAPRLRLTVGWVQGGSSLRMDGDDRSVEATRGVLVGAALPLPFTGALRERLAFGIGLYLPSGVLNRALAPFPDQPRLALLESRSQVVSVLTALSVRLLPNLSIGAGLSTLAALTGEIHLQPDSAGHISSLVTEQLAWAFSPVIGVRWQPIDELRLGLTGHGVSRDDYELRITSELGSLLPIGLPVLRLGGTAQYDPLQLQAEGALRLRGWLTVLAGATYKRWSDFPLPTTNATAATPAQPDTGYHDTVVPRAALEASTDWGNAKVQLRAGYFFEMSPAPRDAPVLLDADRHVFCAGAGLTWPLGTGALQLDAFAQWHKLAGSPRASGQLLVAGATLGVDL